MKRWIVLGVIAIAIVISAPLISAAPGRKFTLTTTTAGNGLGTVTGAGKYSSGTRVTVQEFPAAGSTFAGWSGGCSGGGACVVTMDADKTVTATFTQVQAISPYPPSTSITGITWDFANTVQAGMGSDLWPSTWLANDSLVMAWGDGGGIGGTNTVCRTRFGMHSVTGTPPNLVFAPVWGCRSDGVGCDAGATHNAVCNAPFGGTVATAGVPDGIVAIGDTLYAKVTDTSASGFTRLHQSTDAGHTWTPATWTWSHPPAGAGDWWSWAFVQFGAGYAGQSHLYAVGGKTGDTTHAYLARVPVGSVMTQTAWEWFTGTVASPSWGTWANATPIFFDPNSVGDTISTGGSMQFFPVLNRYVFFHTAGSIQQTHVYDAPNPWGPWTTVYYSDTWGNYGTDGGLNKTVIPKYISADNQTFWVTFSGYGPGGWDRYNLIKGTFVLP